ncbi:cell division protein ZapA [Ferrimonas sediminicola]|uniref:Cell division protein ZapA n=1 Tax=Ferrimonas sediminicola TaxID=2569538 RepID=A0A4U1BF86_9GAMM|nr:cell division protein ZapA [Ferrimonas sediminicola]TKB48675.1 cell division protein ZapA [Ferrimonas sediminicola]
MSPNTIEITLLERVYTVACPPGEEATLQQVAHQLNKRFLELKQRNALLSIDQLAVMASLNLTHELMSLEARTAREAQERTKKIQALENAIEQALCKRELKQPKWVESGSESQ